MQIATAPDSKDPVLTLLAPGAAVGAVVLLDHRPVEHGDLFE